MQAATASASEHQDVYEFHEDSGEENPTANGERPRLIMTIKSPGQPNKESAEPEEKEDATKDDTAHTRKSKRLQEKDRTTVDDIIEDVVRNSQSAQTRRTTRAAAASLAVKNEEPKKSPRNQKKVKDAKAIDATFDSGDEQPVLPKAVSKVVEQPPVVEVEQPKVEEKKPSEPVSILDPKTGVLSFMGQSQPPEQPKVEEPPPHQIPTPVSVVVSTPTVTEVKPTTPTVKLPPKAAHILQQQQLAKQLQQQQQQQQQQANQAPTVQVQPTPQKVVQQTPQAHPIVIQSTQAPQQPTQSIRQHPLKVHVLNSQKHLLQQQQQQQPSPTPQPTVVKPPTHVEQHTMPVPKPQTTPVTSVHQKVVQHPPHNVGMPMHPSNLVVHIPPASSPHNSTPSPRMHTQIHPPQATMKPPQTQIVQNIHGQQQPMPPSIQQQQQQQALNAKQQQLIMQQIQVFIKNFS